MTLPFIAFSKKLLPELHKSSTFMEMLDFNP
jgi:hypothetical protein